MVYDPHVVSLIERIGRRRKVGREALLGALATGIVESGLQNLGGGDADSEGWRQERSSLYPNPRNVRASVNRFFDEWAQHDTPGFNPGLTAANVQRPAEQFRGRYADVMDQAKALLAGKGGFGGSVGSPQDLSQAPAEAPENPFAMIGAMNPGQNPMLQQGWDMLGKIWQNQNQGSTSPMLTDMGGGGQVQAHGKFNPAGLHELFFDPLGGWDEGQNIGAIGGHGDHIHVGGKPNQIALIVQEAQRRGLGVREYSPVDKVDPVHAPNSWHTRYGGKGAADIDPNMSFAKWIRRKYGLR